MDPELSEPGRNRSRPTRSPEPPLRRVVAQISKSALRLRAGALAVAWVWSMFPSAAHAETLSVIVASNAAPRVRFGAENLVEALKSVKLDARK